MDEIHLMNAALREAAKAILHDDVPVGALVVLDGKIIARAHNEREKRNDPTAHAEILALSKAGKKLGVWNLTGAELFVTLEPCPMCAGAIINARIKRLVYGAKDPKAGCAGTLYNLPGDSRFNHRAEVKGGILEKECAELLKNFFKGKRNKIEN